MTSGVRHKVALRYPKVGNMSCADGVLSMKGISLSLFSSFEAAGVTWADEFQAWGAVVSTAIAAWSFYYSRRSGREDRIAQDRRDAKGISVWGAKVVNGDRYGALIRNDCPFSATDFVLKQDSGNMRKLEVEILPPGTWFSEKPENNDWKTCVPLIKDESAPSGWSIEDGGKKLPLQNTINDDHGNPFHFRWYFSLNVEGIWVNRDGCLDFAKRGRKADKAKTEF